MTNALSLISSSSFSQKIEPILGTKTKKFILNCQTIISQNKDLMDCSQESIYGALLTTATLGLSLDKNFGHCYVIPYKIRDKSLIEAQWQLGYKGMGFLLARAGIIKSFIVSDVYEGELVKYNPLLGNTYEFSLEIRKNSKINGYVALATLLDGTNKEVFMTIEEIKLHASKYSKTYNSQIISPWKLAPDAMYKKTVAKKLLTSLLYMCDPFSSVTENISIASEYDQAIIKKNEKDEIELDYIDNPNEIINPKQKKQNEETIKAIELINNCDNTEELDTLKLTFGEDLTRKIIKEFEQKYEFLKND